jgi:hypothetical protein
MMAADEGEAPVDISEYRARIEAEVTAAGGRAEPAEASAEDALAMARDAGTDTGRRLAALRTAVSGIGATPGVVTQLFELLTDSGQPAELRRGVLVVLQELSFRAVALPGLRSDLLGALRGLVQDPDIELRRRVIGVLAREKDEFVQRLLLDGLKGQDPVLVPPAKAIQYLGYDIHAEYFPILRRILDRPPDQDTAKEAIRVLAADPGATELLLERLRDRSQPSDERRLCAVALQTSRPDVLAAEARALVADGSEDEQLRAFALSVLTHLAAGHASDAELAAQVARLAEQARSPELRQASADFFDRRPR